jgi:hypothetical protein
VGAVKRRCWSDPLLRLVYLRFRRKVLAKKSRVGTRAIIRFMSPSRTDRRLCSPVRVSKVSRRILLKAAPRQPPHVGARMGCSVVECCCINVRRGTNFAQLITCIYSFSTIFGRRAYYNNTVTLLIDLSLTI